MDNNWKEINRKLPLFIFELNNGKIELLNSAGGGAVVRLYFPVAY